MMMMMTITYRCTNKGFYPRHQPNSSLLVGPYLSSSDSRFAVLHPLLPHTHTPSPPPNPSLANCSKKKKKKGGGVENNQVLYPFLLSFSLIVTRCANHTQQPCWLWLGQTVIVPCFASAEPVHLPGGFARRNPGLRGPEEEPWWQEFVCASCIDWAPSCTLVW